MYRITRVLLSSIALLVAIYGFGSIAIVCAQSGGATTAGITGSVSDEQGAVVSGVTVTAKNVETNFSRETKTLEDGSYLLQQLPPGNYELSVTVEGFTTQTSRLELALGITTHFDFTLRVGQTSDVVEVKADKVTEDAKTESSTNIDSMRIDTLPINRRNFLDFSLTAPRVTMDRLPAQGASSTSGLSFNGQTARTNNITIDGLDNNDLASNSVRATFSQDAVQEFQVVSDSYSAEFGRALGGVVNIVTRGGGNEYHGSLFFFNRNDNISARDVFAPFRPPYSQYQFGASASGAIKKDKVFFFTSFERLSISQNNFVTIGDESVASANRLGFPLRNGPIPFDLDTTTYLARIDARINPNDSFYVRFNFGGNYNGALEPFGGLVADTNGGISTSQDYNIAITNTYLNTKLNLVNETRVLLGTRKQDVIQTDPGPQVRITAPEGQITFGRSTFVPQFRHEHIYQLVDNITLTRGRNQIKFGIDAERVNLPPNGTNVPIFPGGLAFFQPIDFSKLGGIPGLPTLSGLEAFDPSLRTPAEIGFLNLLSAQLPGLAPGFPAGVPLAQLSLPTAYAQGFGDTFLKVPQTLFSAFVQDDIKIKSNLMVKLGLRYDFEHARFIPQNDGNVAPRFGISYKPTKLPRLNLHGSYGLFFTSLQVVGAALAVENTTVTNNLKLPIVPFPFSILLFNQPGHHFPDGNDLPPGVPLISQLSQSFQYQKHLKNSYAQEVNVGFDYLIGNNTVVSATYDLIRGIKLFSPRNINPVVRIVSPNPAINAMVGRVDPTRGDVFDFESSFDSYYNAFTVSINRRLTNHFGVLAHYTVSKAIDDFIDVRTDLQEAENSLFPRGERGLSLQDVRNRFVLSGIWDLNYTKNKLLTGFQLSSIINLNSGHPFNLLAGEDINMNGDNPPGDRPEIGGVPIGRNTGITPGFADVDLRLTRTVTVKERYRIQGFLEIFNLFNRVNINDIDRIYPPNADGTFDLPAKDGSGRFIATPDRFRSAFATRQFQLGFRVNF